MKIIDADKLEVDAMSDGVTTSVECVTMEQIKNAPLVSNFMNWILCNNKQPTKEGAYLVTDADMQVRIVHYRLWGWGANEIIAWMPLPEPYKAR